MLARTGNTTRGKPTTTDSEKPMEEGAHSVRMGRGRGGKDEGGGGKDEGDLPNLNSWDRPSWGKLVSTSPLIPSRTNIM